MHAHVKIMIFHASIIFHTILKKVKVVIVFGFNVSVANFLGNLSYLISIKL